MAGIKAGLTGFSPHIRLLGTSCWIAWVTLIYSSEQLIPGASFVYEATSLSFVVSTLALSVCMVAFSSAPRFTANLLSKRALIQILSVLAAFATFAVIAPGIVPPAVTFCGAAVTGCVTSLIALRSAVLLSEIDTKNMLIAMCGILILGVLLYSWATMMTLYGLPVVAAAVLLLLLPAAVFFLWTPVDDEEELSVVDDSSLPRSFWRLLIYIILLMFMLCVIRGYYPSLIDASQFGVSRGTVAAGLMLGGTVIACVAASMPRGASFGTLCYVLLTLSVFATPVLVLIGAGPTLTGNISAVLFGTTLMCFWGLLCRVSFRSGFSVIRVFGFGFGAACFGATLGFLAGGMLLTFGADQDLLKLFSGGALILCLIAATFLLRKDDLGRLMEPPIGEELDCPECDIESETDRDDTSSETVKAVASVEPVSPLNDYRESLGRVCGHIALEHNLSPREADVLCLLVEGKDAKTIADELFISFNTVRCHIRKIYSKTGVHNRSELRKLVEDESSRAQSAL